MTKKAKALPQETHDMGEKLDGIMEFRQKCCDFIREEIKLREKALEHMDAHPLVESDKETRLMRESQCRDLRLEIKLLRSNLNTIERML